MLEKIFFSTNLHADLPVRLSMEPLFIIANIANHPYDRKRVIYL